MLLIFFWGGCFCLFVFVLGNFNFVYWKRTDMGKGDWVLWSLSDNVWNFQLILLKQVNTIKQKMNIGPLLTCIFICQVSSGRTIVIVTWEGQDPSLKSIFLNSHIDVVPVFPVKRLPNYRTNSVTLWFCTFYMKIFKKKRKTNAKYTHFALKIWNLIMRNLTQISKISYILIQV